MEEIIEAFKNTFGGNYNLEKQESFGEKMVITEYFFKYKDLTLLQAKFSRPPCKDNPKALEANERFARIRLLALLFKNLDIGLGSNYLPNIASSENYEDSLYSLYKKDSDEGKLPYDCYGYSALERQLVYYKSKPEVIESEIKDEEFNLDFSNMPQCENKINK